MMCSVTLLSTTGHLLHAIISMDRGEERVRLSKPHHLKVPQNDFDEQNALRAK
jgi:hypothetical protein